MEHQAAENTTNRQRMKMGLKPLNLTGPPVDRTFVDLAKKYPLALKVFEMNIKQNKRGLWE
jgi:hypothetical protein